MADVFNAAENLEMLTAFSSIYISVHLFDLKNDVIKAFKSNPFIDRYAEQAEGVRDKVANVMRNIAKEDHVKFIVDFVDFSTLSERMKGKNELSMAFEGKINGWCRATFIVMEKEGDEITRMLFTVMCINEEKKREDHLLYLAGIDLMTGLYNRGHGESRIKDYFSNGQKGVFCLFDVDKFKLVNDSYGHDVGDKVLIAVADCLRKTRRDNDIVMRLGGDEFAAFFTDVTENEIGDIIGKLFDAIDSISISPIKEKIRISLGATFAKPGMDFDTAYKMADEGVYKSKNMKNSSYVIIS